MYGRNPGYPEHYNSYLWMVAKKDYDAPMVCEVIGNVWENPELLEVEQERTI